MSLPNIERHQINLIFFFFFIFKEEHLFSLLCKVVAFY